MLKNARLNYAKEIQMSSSNIINLKTTVTNQRFHAQQPKAIADKTFKQRMRKCDKFILDLTRQSSDEGEASSQYELADYYLEGFGVKKDHNEALRLYRLAAEQGYAKAQVCLGIIYSGWNNYFGSKIIDYKESMKWYRLAAHQGHEGAQYVIGWMYANGQGIDQDYKEAVKWYRLTAQQGDSSGQFQLGMSYDTGQGVDQDYVRAHMWFNMAASQGYRDACSCRDIVEKKMSPEQIEKAQAMAWRCQSSKFKNCD